MKKKIRSLLNMNNGRKNMRKALGMDLEEKQMLQLNGFVFGEFLGKGKAKKRVVDNELKERKILISEYKVKVKTLKSKIENEN